MDPEPDAGFVKLARVVQAGVIDAGGGGAGIVVDGDVCVNAVMAMAVATARTIKRETIIGVLVLLAVWLKLMAFDCSL